MLVRRDFNDNDEPSDDEHLGSTPEGSLCAVYLPALLKESFGSSGRDVAVKPSAQKPGRCWHRWQDL